MRSTHNQSQYSSHWDPLTPPSTSVWVAKLLYTSRPQLISHRTYFTCFLICHLLFLHGWLLRLPNITFLCNCAALIGLSYMQHFMYHHAIAMHIRIYYTIPYTQKIVDKNIWVIRPQYQLVKSLCYRNSKTCKFPHLLLIYKLRASPMIKYSIWC
jgi:hypothetical protein